MKIIFPKTWTIYSDAACYNSIAKIMQWPILAINQHIHHLQAYW